jgi:hypothetical protein
MALDQPSTSSIAAFGEAGSCGQIRSPARPARHALLHHARLEGARRGAEAVQV